MRNIIKCLGIPLLLAGLAQGALAKELYIANWSDYVAEDTIANFERETGIRVHYFEYEDMEGLEKVWLEEGRHFDIVFPDSDNLPAYIAGGHLQPLERDRLPNWKLNDPEFMQRLAQVDPGNRYAIPYMWGTVGIGYNVEAVRAAFGGRLPEDSWDLLFDPDKLSKLASCGVTLLASPEEIFDVGLKYLGKEPNSMSTAHQYLVGNLLAKVRLYVADFDSAEYKENLASGKHCLVHGWSGDILAAQQMAREQGRDFEIRYIMPREGFPMWLDTVALTADAQNTDEAYQFMQYLMRPRVIAEISNAVHFANANVQARELVDESLRANPIVYPDAKDLQNAWNTSPTEKRVLDLRHKLWRRLIDREAL